MSHPAVSFYVYNLVDPRDGLPFYVGKGQGRRAWEHQRLVQAGRPGVNAGKVARIRDILDAGLEVEVQIVAVFALEVDALEHEFRLIDSDPTLTNMIPGGGGVARILETPEEAQARYQAGRKHLLRSARQRDLERADRKIKQFAYRNRPISERHQAEINAWQASLREKDKLALLRSQPASYQTLKKRAKMEMAQAEIGAEQRKAERDARRAAGNKSGRDPEARKRARIRRDALRAGLLPPPEDR